MRGLHKLVAFFIITIFISCQSDNEKVIIQPVQSDWSADKTINFEFEITQIEALKNLTFVIRNNENYPFSNLFLITKLSLKGDDKSITDTLNYALAKDNGDWIGSGFGGIKELNVEYKPQFKFPKKGLYKLEIRHGMREKRLKGIEDIGIKIEEQTLLQN